MAEVRPRNIPESFFPLKNICLAGSLTNQVFQRKTLVIKMMNVDGRASTFCFRGITLKPLEIFSGL